MTSIIINGNNIEATSGLTILEAAKEAGIYIPSLCNHPDLKPFHSIGITNQVFQGSIVYKNDPDATIESIKGCGICVVDVEGEVNPVPSCKTIITNGMVILTDTEIIRNKRQKNLIPILAKHPHSCLTCSQLEGCITVSDDCSNSVPMNERCCELNGNCELQRLTDYIGIAPETPKFHYPAYPRIYDGELFIRDYNLCISCGRCVRACEQLREVFALGAVIHDGKLIVGTIKGPNLEDSDCRFCGACVEVCPTGAIQDKNKPRLKEKSDYIPCQANCPGDTDIPLYLKYIAEGEYSSSAEVISSRLSFPHSLGKICFHPCESECRRVSLSGSINIRLAKDFAMSRSDIDAPDIIKHTGKLINIIGAGPAGLTAAFYLSLKGHNVTVFEKEQKIGGMLRYGIPRYRLTEDTLDKDIKRLLQSGMTINTGVNVEGDMSHILNNADAVYIATGLSKSRRLPTPIIDDENIYYGVEFLNSVAKNELSSNIFERKKIVVIGGGNVATDAARTALRLGASKITIVCLESFDEMPAYTQEIDEAIEEGIIIDNNWGISNITKSDNGRLIIDLMKCISVFDDKDNFAPKYDYNINSNLSGDSVVICIGQESESSIFDKNTTNMMYNQGLIKIKNGTCQTNINKVFAGGDIVSGPASVIDAIGNAKQAAREIDAYLGGDGIISGDSASSIIFDSKIGKIEGFCKFRRVESLLADTETRKNNFQSVEIAYDENNAQTEAGRCLQCNLRMNISQNLYPPEKYLKFIVNNIELINSEEGVIQLLNVDKESFLIKGSDNIKDTLVGFLEDGIEASYFTYEYDQLFSKRESELIQQYLQKHGEMPDSGDDLDDLF